MLKDCPDCVTDWHRALYWTAGAMPLQTEFLNPGPLGDGVINLELLGTTRGNPAEDEVPTYRFAISLALTGEEVGGINFRVGLNATILCLRGQVGFVIDQAHQGNGFARRACALLLPFAQRHGLSELWITCDPDNIASRRTIEAVGAELVEVVHVPSGTRFYDEGSRQKCRYRIGLVE